MRTFLPPTPTPESTSDQEDFSGAITSKITSQQPSFDLSVIVPSISLEIFSSKESLAKVSILSSRVKMSSLLDGSSEMEIQVSSLGITDSRPNIDSLFKNVFRSSHTRDGSMLIIQSSRGPIPSPTLMTFSFDGPKITLVLDHLFELLDFFAPNPNSLANGKADAPEHAIQERQVGITYRYNIVDFEVIILQNQKSASTEAIILASRQLVVSQDLVTSYSALELGMFFCAMDQRSETTLRFIQNFDVSVIVENASTTPGHVVSNIFIDLTPLMVRVSYMDVMLILDILNQITVLSNRSKISQAETDILPDSSSTNIPIVMSRERLQFSTQGFRIIVIDDLNDLHLPMFDLIVEKAGADVSDWSTQMLVDYSMSLHINYFNIKNSHWEPLVEPWSCTFNVTKTSEGQMAISFHSRKKMEVNISHVFIETCLKTIDRWDKQTEVNYC